MEQQELLEERRQAGRQQLQLSFMGHVEHEVENISLGSGGGCGVPLLLFEAATEDYCAAKDGKDKW